jgi:hypothetical protein
MESKGVSEEAESKRNGTLAVLQQTVRDHVGEEYRRNM